MFGTNKVIKEIPSVLTSIQNGNYGTRLTAAGSSSGIPVHHCSTWPQIERYDRRPPFTGRRPADGGGSDHARYGRDCGRSAPTRRTTY